MNTQELLQRYFDLKRKAEGYESRYNEVNNSINKSKQSLRNSPMVEASDLDALDALQEQLDNMEAENKKEKSEITKLHSEIKQKLSKIDNKPIVTNIRVTDNNKEEYRNFRFYLDDMTNSVRCALVK